MLPWFFHRHIFSDRQEAFVSAPQVRDSSTEMGKENRKFTSGSVLVCLFLFGSESVCIQTPYPRGLLSLNPGFEGSVLTWFPPGSHLVLTWFSPAPLSAHRNP